MGAAGGGVAMRLIMLKAGSNFASYRNEYLHLPGCKCGANVKAIQLTKPKDMFPTTLLDFSFCTLAFSQITCESKVFRLLVNFYSAIKVAANFTHFLRLLGIIPFWQRRKHGTSPSYYDGKRERTDWLGK